MTNDPGFFVSVGIKLPDLIAGFAGGVVNALALKRADPKSIIGSVIVGGLTANYLSEFFQHYFGTSASTSGFLVGLGGMALCQGLIAGMSKLNFIGSQQKANPDASSNP